MNEETIMKKLILGLLITSTTTVFAATSGNINLSGTIDPVLSISLSSSSYNTLDLENGGDTSIATATEQCNDLDGYKVFGYSTNGSELRLDGTNTTHKTSYTVKYDGANSGVSLGAGVANRVQLKDSGVLSGLTSDTSDLTVNVTGNSNLPAGTYSDVITLQIQAN